MVFGRKILILVPHPDDEVVACAAAIGRAQKEGADIYALYLTHGCIARNEMWPWERKHYTAAVTRRQMEAKQVAAGLRITPAGWSQRPARHLWRDMENVTHEIEEAIARHRIDQLWTPAYEGGNPDHDALNAICQLFIGRVSVLEFAEYNFKGGVACSHTFPDENGTEKRLMLTPEERLRKKHAIKLYASEQKNLGYVEMVRECYRPLAEYAYSRPPHEGTLWYARFQWVPFRHPRVDFTKPEEVSSAITRFIGG